MMGDVKTRTGVAGVSPVERLHALVGADMAATDKLIHVRMHSGVPLIPDLAQHLIDSGGKRLRPLLTLAAATAGGHFAAHSPLHADLPGSLSPSKV